MFASQPPTAAEAFDGPAGMLDAARAAPAYCGLGELAAIS